MGPRDKVRRTLEIAARVLLLQLQLAQVARADEPAPQSTPKIQVQVQAIAPDADTSAFAKDPHYQVHAAPSSYPATGLPLPADRDSVFARAGLAPSLEGWDAVDRDVLFTRSRGLSLHKLKAHYPKLSESKLRKLQELVKAAPRR